MNTKKFIINSSYDRNILIPPLTFNYLTPIFSIPEQLTTFKSLCCFFGSYFHISKYAYIVLYSSTNFRPIHFCPVYVDEDSFLTLPFAPHSPYLPNMVRNTVCYTIHDHELCRYCSLLSPLYTVVIFFPCTVFDFA